MARVFLAVFALDVETKDRESRIVLFFTPRRMNIYDEIGKHMTAATRHATRAQKQKLSIVDCFLLFEKILNFLTPRNNQATHNAKVFCCLW